MPTRSAGWRPGPFGLRNLLSCCRPKRYNFVAVRFRRENLLPSFGAKLKLEREKRAVTLEQISLSTKIGMRMLQALEEDKFNQLPGGIFNKGFVRAYAHHIGLDEDQTITEYLEASGEGPAPEPEAAVES